MTNKPAILGGTPVKEVPFTPYNTITETEINAAVEVMKTGILSGYVANPGPEFLGGQWTLELEEEFKKYFDCKFAISLNSATSGLHAALAAAGVGPGDEVIVSPYSMSASSTSAVMCGGTPVFVDIEPDTFCLKVEEVKKAITPKTKAIMAVNIFGLPADLGPLRELANENNLILVEDNAQAPAGKYNGQWTGTVGDMGVFSLNRHKTMQCGEGGVVITNNETLAKRLRMVRNHGETVLPEWGDELKGHEDIIGFNYRLTEMQAAIATPQVKRIKELNDFRTVLADYLSEKLEDIDFLTAPKIRENCTHVYYLYPMIFSPEKAGISRDRFVEAMRAEGMPVANYVRPLYHIPLYKNRCGEHPSYNPENHPVVEKLWKETMVVTPICHPPLTKQDIDLFVEAIKKIRDSAAKL
jgi:dTDP-4-amino-4,6-dideoxygalactose transaminase